MLTDEDTEWISLTYPGLILIVGGIVGPLEFTATYNPESDRFLQIDDNTNDAVGGLRLSARFGIRIEERSDTTHSRLPALFVEDIDRSINPHFNQTDGSGCVCNPLEEDEFLHPRLDFRRYMKELVIPFLYGQAFFSKEGRWPWFEYAHGNLGLIEACGRKPTREVIDECLRRISCEPALWKKVKPLLLQKSYIKGHTRCPCPKNDHLRRCHPHVLRGLQALQDDVVERKLLLP